MLYKWVCLDFMQVPLLPVWTPALCTTPSQRWESDGSPMIYWHFLLPWKTSLKTPQQCSLTTESWQVSPLRERKNQWLVTYNKIIGSSTFFLLLLQAMSSLAAITGLYMFSRKMVLPRRAKIAISLLTAMAYTQVSDQSTRNINKNIHLPPSEPSAACFCRSSSPCPCRSPLASAPCYSMSQLRWQQLTSPALWLFSHWPFGFWQSFAKCPNKTALTARFWTQQTHERHALKWLRLDSNIMTEDIWLKKCHQGFWINTD